MKDLKGEINLIHCKQLSAYHYHPKHKWCFSCVTPEREYFLAADSEPEMLEVNGPGHGRYRTAEPRHPCQGVCLSSLSASGDRNARGSRRGGLLVELFRRGLIGRRTSHRGRTASVVMATVGTRGTWECCVSRVGI